MKPPIIVNENATIDCGDLNVFGTIPALEAYLEPWYVDEPHFIFDSEGMQLDIAPIKHGVLLSPKDPRTINPEIARLYFSTFLKSIARAKGWNYVGVTEAFVETAPLFELAQASAKFASR